MNEIEFFLSKNQSENVKVNKINLHSNYNPQVEAERYADNFTLPFKVLSIVICEPALAYILPLLKNKYPQIKIGCIRYTKEFSPYNKDFDFVINYYEHKENFDEYLFNYFGEEDLLKTHFQFWDASSRAFLTETEATKKAVISAIQKAKTLLVTREYFEKKWIINSINFLKYLNKTIKISGIDKDILILASGPSLKALLKNLNEIKNHFFIICLSSAISVLKYNKIEPDLYLSTDGGFWAGQHLKRIEKNIPLAISSEAYCPKKLISESIILPLNYEDGTSSFLLSGQNISFTKAERNGTVSGTALDLALELGSKDIYFAGLDLFSKADYSHANPNQIEINSSIKENRINSKEKHASSNLRGSYSLEVYRDWFSSKQTGSRKVYRIIDEKHNELGQIKDISSKEFFNIFLSKKESSQNNIKKEKSDFSLNKEKLNKKIQDLFSDQAHLKEIFPLTYNSLFRNPDEKELLERLKDNKEKLYKRLIKIIND